MPLANLVLLLMEEQGFTLALPTRGFPETQFFLIFSTTQNLFFFQLPDLGILKILELLLH